MEEAQRGVEWPVEMLEEQRLGADRVDRDVLSAMNAYAGGDAHAISLMSAAIAADSSSAARLTTSRARGPLSSAIPPRASRAQSPTARGCPRASCAVRTASAAYASRCPSRAKICAPSRPQSVLRTLPRHASDPTF